MDGEIPYLPTGGVAELLGLGNGPLQRDTHIPQGHETGVRVLVFAPVLGKLPGRELKHGKAQNIRGLVNVSGGAVNLLDALVVGDQDVDFAFGGNPLRL